MSIRSACWSLVVAAVAGLSLPGRTVAASGPEIGKAPPALPAGKLWNIGEKDFSWKQFQGKVVILDFWNWH